MISSYFSVQKYFFLFCEILKADRIFRKNETIPSIKDRAEF